MPSSFKALSTAGIKERYRTQKVGRNSKLEKRSFQLAFVCYSFACKIYKMENFILLLAKLNLSQITILPKNANPNPFKLLELFFPKGFINMVFLTEIFNQN